MTVYTKAWLKDDAVLWAATGDFDRYGKVLISSATGTAIKCRWPTRQGETLNNNNETITYEHRVQVGIDIAVGSILWEGKLADVPSPTSNLNQVVGVNKIKDIKGRIAYREVFLIRFGDTLPSTA